MAYWLDSIHEQIIKFLKENSGVELTLMDIWDAVWLNHSQKVLNKLEQLEKKWYIRKNFETKTYDVLDEPVKDTIYLRLYWSAQCWNKGPDIITEEPTKMIWFDTTISGIKNADQYILVEAKWESMKPEIKEGSILLVYLQNTNYSFQDKVLVVHNWKAKVKRIIGKWKEKYLISSNESKEDFPDIKVDENDQLDVIWVVKKIISNP